MYSYLQIGVAGRLDGDTLNGVAIGVWHQLDDALNLQAVVDLRQLQAQILEIKQSTARGSEKAKETGSRFFKGKAVSPGVTACPPPLLRSR